MIESTVYLSNIHAGNWRECIELDVDTSQRGFVSSNLFSLAQAKYETCRVPCGVYVKNDSCGDSGCEAMVGFAMYNNRSLPEGGFRISRLMIDASQQGRGYGFSAARLVIDKLKQLPLCQEIRLDYHPDNHRAARFWRRLGFVELGRLGDNIELGLKVD